MFELNCTFVKSPKSEVYRKKSLMELEAKIEVELRYKKQQEGGQKSAEVVESMGWSKKRNNQESVIVD